MEQLQVDPEIAKPWVDIKAATSQQIVYQVEQCPSGALSVRK